ncbi:hypothetical protein [Fibrisoma limi]|uniref:hypothetical protein n=1 Tax=Fibrisoma limi TaxID=663275 RepID=UPI00030BB977|nr:hypothetical protein [Fibrisoma limi]
MDRFTVLYQLNNHYFYIGCSTYLLADLTLSNVQSVHSGEPLGIYDAKTELFQWEPVRRHYYNKLSIEEQARHDLRIIRIVHQLREEAVAAVLN